jgi:hypothetical protein
VKDGYITAAEAARKLGLNPEYAAQLARRSHQTGNPWPQKKGRYWYAPMAEWTKILSPKDKVKRKRRKNVQVKESKVTDNLVTAAEAARFFGISRGWAATLARRSRQAGNPWPQKMGRFWMAPFDEWKWIFESDLLKSWSRNSKK